MEYTTFGRTGLKVSRLGLGGAPIGGDFGPTDEAEIERVIHEAIDLGINFIDTAPLYGSGKSEERIGKALTGGKRDQVVLATKAVRSDQTYDYANTIRSVEQSLLRLRTDRIDLLQLHDIERQSYELVLGETIPALQRLQADGKIRYLGVTTYDLPLLMRYMETDVFDSAQFYARYMLLDYSAAIAVIPLAKKKNIALINGSVLGMGLLADTPAKFLRDDVRQEAALRMEKLAFLRRAEPNGLVEPAMRFSLGQPDIQVTLTGTASLTSLKANASYCDGKGLDAEDQRRVMALFADSKSLFS
ncbi:aldo/keto reductase [Paenibacillus eucommiae]|uniref:L-galactose dehydrogenase n=1 Tax=Paenibacillus eucommiae TaxID=1355755 RepID=A0ABS4IRJ6_9BACL|nr:aldo/keto reductase [Paenibacillus eucommiae]MBP1990182.1 L-galactose dehydrogenase [Paenibacillus eucommiae]